MSPRAIKGIRRGKGRVQILVSNREVLMEMSKLEEQMVAMDIDQHREPEVGDPSYEKEESSEEEEVVEELAEDNIFKVVLGSNMKPKTDFYSYIGGMNREELIERITKMDKFFKYEETDEEKNVSFVVTSLKGHVTLWWDCVQTETRERTSKRLRVGIGW